MRALDGLGLGREDALFADGRVDPGPPKDVEHLVAEPADAHPEPAVSQTIEDLHEAFGRLFVDPFEGVAGDDQAAQFGEAVDHGIDAAGEMFERGVIEPAVEPDDREASAPRQRVPPCTAEGSVGVERELRDVR